MLFLQVIDGSAIIAKAVILHCPVYIALRHLFGLFQRLVVQSFIKAVFKVVVDHYLIPRSHATGIIVDSLFCQPFGFFGEGIVKLPHLFDLIVHIACPQVLFAAASRA